MGNVAENTARRAEEQSVHDEVRGGRCSEVDGREDVYVSASLRADDGHQHDDDVDDRDPAVNKGDERLAYSRLVDAFRVAPTVAPMWTALYGRLYSTVIAPYRAK